jgi:hypothetical protein
MTFGNGGGSFGGDVELLPNQMASASHQRTHEVSVEILKALQAAGIPTGYAIFGTALTLGRLMCADEPDALTQEQEAKFVSGVLDWCGAFFHDGPSH